MTSTQVRPLRADLSDNKKTSIPQRALCCVFQAIPDNTFFSTILNTKRLFFYPKKYKSHIRFKTKKTTRKCYIADMLQKSAACDMAGIQTVQLMAKRRLQKKNKWINKR